MKRYIFIMLRCVFSLALSACSGDVLDSNSSNSLTASELDLLKTVDRLTTQ